MPQRKALSSRETKLATVANLAPALETKVARANEQYARLGATDKENSLRGLFLGGLFQQIKDDAGHGNFLPLAKARMPDIPQERRNELMRLWGAFVKATKLAVPAQLAIPDAQLALQLGQETDDEIVRAALKFVGGQSLYALMVEHDVLKKQKLGGKRTATPAAPTAVSAEQLAALSKQELSDKVEGLRQLLLTDNVCQHLSEDEIRALDQSLEGILTRWRAALRKTLNR